MTCRGLGICGCGAPPCAENAWWFHFCGTWRVLAFELFEAVRDAMTDDQIDFEREQAHE